MQAPPPGLELVRGAWGFIVDVLDSSLLEILMDATARGRAFFRSHAHVEQSHPPGELVGLLQQAAVSSLDARETEWRAEDADIGKLIEVGLGNLIGLRSAERQAGHGPVLAIGQGA